MSTSPAEYVTEQKLQKGLWVSIDIIAASLPDNIIGFLDGKDRNSILKWHFTKKSSDFGHIKKQRLSRVRQGKSQFERLGRLVQSEFD